jgi:hypothetical protein
MVKLTTFQVNKIPLQHKTNTKLHDLLHGAMTVRGHVYVVYVGYFPYLIAIYTTVYTLRIKL